MRPQVVPQETRLPEAMRPMPDALLEQAKSEQARKVTSTEPPFSRHRMPIPLPKGVRTMTLLDNPDDLRLPPATVGRLTASDRRLLRELALKLATPHDGETDNQLSQTPRDLSPYITPWLSHLLAEGAAPQTLATYAIHIKVLLRHHPSPTEGDLEAFLAARAAAGISTSTIHVQVSAFKSFFTHLTQADILPADVTAHLKSPRRTYKERRPAHPEDVAQILASPAATTRDRALILLLADGGLRISEALSLTVDHLDARAFSVSVIGKGRRERDIPLSDTTISALIRHIRTLPLASLWVFPGSTPAKHLTKDTIHHRFRRLCDAAGVPRFTPHQLRHYYATSMLNDGANLRVVSELLGHATPSVTVNVYWHSAGAGQRRREHELHSPLKGIVSQANSREAPPDDTDEMG